MNKQIYIEAIGLLLVGVILVLTGHYTSIPSLDTVGEMLMSSSAVYLVAALRGINLASNQDKPK